MVFKKGHRGFSRRRTGEAIETPTPSSNRRRVLEDDEMLQSDTPRSRRKVQDQDGAEDEDEGDAITPAAEPTEDEDDEDAESPPAITTFPRRRGRAGRARSTRTSNAHNLEPGGGDEGSESGTPVRRRRGRPPGPSSGRGRGGFRGRRKGQQPEAPRVVIDKDGTVLDVVDDEALVDDDPEGNEKVDSNGELQDGREYRVRTFTIAGRGDRLYMLSTEPARCCGFRDSYLFFTKHPKLYKVLIGEDEKKDLIDRGILPNSYKGRNIGVVTARSVFREFGARIIVGGRKVTDDYKVADARANGEIEGELADPDDRVPEKNEEYNRNRYVAWFGASDVYRSTGGGGTLPPGKPGHLSKRRNNITLENWQFMHAREASRSNTAMTAMRRANLEGVYDANTNMMFYPKIMQPTHAKWEWIPPNSVSSDTKRYTNGMTNGHRTVNGNTFTSYEHDTEMQIDDEDFSRTQASSFTAQFAPVPAAVSRNFTVVDTHFDAPPISHAGYPGPDGDIEDPSSGPNGLGSISQEIIDELPADCRAAFEEARSTERRWKQQWGTEAHSGHRGGLKIGYTGYPV